MSGRDDRRITCASERVTSFEHALGAYRVSRASPARLGERGSSRGWSRKRGIVRRCALLTSASSFSRRAARRCGVRICEDVARRCSLRAEIPRALLEFSSCAARRPPNRGHDSRRGVGAPRERDLLIPRIARPRKIEYLKRGAHIAECRTGKSTWIGLCMHSSCSSPRCRAASSSATRTRGRSAPESRLFAKRQMYRNVYWHQAVRSARQCTSAWSRMTRVRRARDAGALAYFRRRTPGHCGAPRQRRADGLQRRTLWKRAAVSSPAALDAVTSNGFRPTRSRAGARERSHARARTGSRPVMCSSTAR